MDVCFASAAAQCLRDRRACRASATPSPVSPSGGEARARPGSGPGSRVPTLPTSPTVERTSQHSPRGPQEEAEFSPQDRILSSILKASLTSLEQLSSSDLQTEESPEAISAGSSLRIRSESSSRKSSRRSMQGTRPTTSCVVVQTPAERTSPSEEETQRVAVEGPKPAGKVSKPITQTPSKHPPPSPPEKPPCRMEEPSVPLPRSPGLRRTRPLYAMPCGLYVLCALSGVVVSSAAMFVILTALSLTHTPV
eukprot:RCo031567